MVSPDSNCGDGEKGVYHEGREGKTDNAETIVLVAPRADGEVDKASDDLGLGLDETLCFVLLGTSDDVGESGVGGRGLERVFADLPVITAIWGDGELAFREIDGVGAE